MADDDGIAYVEKLLTEAYDYKKTGIIGFGADCRFECMNRVFRVVEEPDGVFPVEIEADQRHAEWAAGQLGLSKASGVSTPSVKRTAAEVEADLKAPA